MHNFRPVRSHGSLGFTLVELLIVITIIVVLLALLVPALDKAVYQAELAVCGSQLKAIATGGSTYAMENQRRYPDTGNNANENPQQFRIGGSNGPASDRRKVLRSALGDLNKILNDPLTNAKLDFEGSTAKHIFANYNIWFGWSYAGHKGLKRMGDQYTWTEKSLADSSYSRTRSSTVVAADRDEIARPGEAQSSHPDADGFLYLLRQQDDPNAWGNATTSGPTGNTVTLALWWSGRDKGSHRGLTDSNFARADGAVVRFNDIQWNEDDRLARAPIYPDGTSYYPQYFHYMPPE